MRTARVLVVAVCLGLLPAMASAQWPDVTTNPYPVSPAAGNHVLTGMESDEYYGVMFGWYSGGEARVQHLNPIAEELWNTEPGADKGLVVAATGLTETQVSVSADGLVGAYVAWTDDIDAAGGTQQRICLMRIRDNGCERALAGTLEVRPLISVPLSFTSAAPDARKVTLRTTGLTGTLVFASGSASVAARSTLLSDDLTFSDQSTVVTGSGFYGADASPGGGDDAVSAGDMVKLNYDGKWYEVASVDSDTRLALAAQFVAVRGRGLTGWLEFTNGNTGVTGIGTNLYGPDLALGGGDDEVTAGDLVRLESDGTWYLVSTVDSDSQLTLSVAYGGSDAKGASSVSPASPSGAGAVIAQADRADLFGADDSPGGGDDEVAAGDYVRLDADDVWFEVKQVVSDNELTLVSSYYATGGAGAASTVAAADYADLTKEVAIGEYVSLDGVSGWYEVASVAPAMITLATDYTDADGTGPARNGTRVKGTDSMFLYQVRGGDLIMLDADGLWVKTRGVWSNTELSLALPYSGAAAAPGTGKATTTLALGDLTFTADDTAVTGGTDLHLLVEERDFIRLDDDGIWVQVGSVDPTGTQLTLTEAYKGTGGTKTARLQRAIRFRSSVSEAGYTCHSPHVLGTGGGAYVAYLNEDLGIPTLGPEVVPFLELAYVDGEGALQWRTGLGFPHPDHTGYVPGESRDHSIRMFPDGEGGVVIVWNEPTFVDEYGPLQRAASTWAARINTAGDGVWGPDPILLFRRGEDAYNPALVNTASVATDGEGGLWVAGRWWFPQAGGRTRCDNGNYVIVNHLLPSGDWELDEWIKPAEWDSDEKGSVGTVPRFARYKTNQNTPSLAQDGEGGAYVVMEDDRMSPLGTPVPLTNPITVLYSSPTVTATPDFNGEVTPGDLISVTATGIWVEVQSVDGATTATLTTPYPGTNETDVAGSVISAPAASTYFSPNESLYAQHIAQGGIPLWNDNDAGYYVSGGLPQSYPWIEGKKILLGAYEKKSSATICRPWVSKDPVEGTAYRNPMVCVWADSEGGANFHIRATELTQIVDGNATMSWPMGIITVCGTPGVDKPGANRDLFVTADERFGTNVAWSQDDGRIYAMHFNFYKMFEEGRAGVLGRGPDIFPAPPVVDLDAIPGPGQVKLTWITPLTSPGGVKPLWDWAGTMIRRSTVGYPLGPDEGDLIYAGPESAFTDREVDSGVLYYYTAFTFDTELSHPNFSGPVFKSVQVQFDDVDDFVAGGLDSAVQLSWREPSGSEYAGVLILRSASHYPTKSEMRSPAADTYTVGVFARGVESHLDDDADGTGPDDFTQLTNGVVYYYTAFAYDSIGPNYTDGIMASAAPLPAVADLTAQGGDGRVGLSWTFTNTDGIAGVLIRRSEITFPIAPDMGGLVVDIAGNTTTTYTDTGVVNGTTYYYSAFAYDTDTNYAAPASDSTVAGDFTPPATPAFLVATPGDGIVTLDWQNPTDPDFKEIVIVRSVSDYPASIADGVEIYAGTDTSCDDTDVVNGTPYYYSAFAIDQNDPPNVSTPATDSAMPVDDGPPGDVSGFTAVAGVGSVSLFWDAPSATDLQGLILIRTEGSYATSPWAPFTGAPAPGAVFWLLDKEEYGDSLPTENMDIDVVNGVTYYYAIWAYDDEPVPMTNFSVNPGQRTATPVSNFVPYFTGGTPTVTPTEHTATFDWTASEPVRGRIDCGIDLTPLLGAGSTRYDSRASWSTFAASGSETLSGLKGNTTYVYRAVITDTDGATNSPAAVGSFTTADMGSGEDNDAGIGDGMEDAWEIAHGLDANVDDSLVDTDGDGLLNIWEYRLGTDPDVADTDGDRINDFTELQRGTDPLVPFVSLPPLGETDDGCGASGGAKGGWMLALAAAALAVLRLRRRAARPRPNGRGS